MAEATNISWAHSTQNFWVGCDKVAPECAKCYIDRVLRRMGREPWGQIYKTKTWAKPLVWEKQAAKEDRYYRVFTCSLSDFFHVKADQWRNEAWDIIRITPHLKWLILTKRPELISKRLPADWGQGYDNVWLGVSTGCNMTLNKMDTLRNIPAKVRFISAEPLLEDISQKINLDGFHWGITGGESGPGQEYKYSGKYWRSEFDHGGRRTMELGWAKNLLAKFHDRGLPFWFKQITAPLPGQGEDALGQVYHEVPAIEGQWGEKAKAA